MAGYLISNVNLVISASGGEWLLLRPWPHSAHCPLIPVEYGISFVCWRLNRAIAGMAQFCVQETIRCGACKGCGMQIHIRVESNKWKIQITGSNRELLILNGIIYFSNITMQTMINTLEMLYTCITTHSPRMWHDWPLIFSTFRHLIKWGPSTYDIAVNISIDAWFSAL